MEVILGIFTTVLALIVALVKWRTSGNYTQFKDKKERINIDNAIARSDSKTIGVKLSSLYDRVRRKNRRTP